MLLNVLVVLQFTHCCEIELQLLITLLLNANFLTSNLNHLLNNFSHDLSDHHCQDQKINHY